MQEQVAAQAANVQPIHVVVARPSPRASTIAGLLACGFAFVGIFVLPLIFVPIAMLCAAVGLGASLFRLNAPGLLASGLGLLLAAAAAVKSPAIWLALGFGLFALGASHDDAPPNASTPNTSHAAAPAERAYQPHEPRPPEGAQTIQAAAEVARRFNIHSPTAVQKLGRYDDLYRAITGTLTPAASHMDELSPAEHEALLRAIDRAKGRTEAARAEVLANRRDLESGLPELMAVIGEAATACKQRRDLAGYPDCDALSSELTGVKSNIEALTARFEALEATYQAEVARQAAVAERAGAI